jgi:hypothetical protein
VTSGASPVANIQVEVFDPSDNPVNSAVTGSDGTYSIGGLANGNYHVCFDGSLATDTSPTGYVDQCYNAKAWNGIDPPSTTAANTVVVTSGTDTPNINAAMVKAGGISGTVKDSALGNPPVSGAEVEVFSSTGQLLGSAFTAADGTYLVGGLATGTDFVCFDGSFGSSSASPGPFGDKCYLNHTWDGTTPPASPDNTVSVTAGLVHTAINQTLTALP